MYEPQEDEAVRSDEGGKIKEEHLLSLDLTGKIEEPDKVIVDPQVSPVLPPQSSLTSPSAPPMGGAVDYVLLQQPRSRFDKITATVENMVAPLSSGSATSSHEAMKPPKGGQAPLLVTDALLHDVPRESKHGATHARPSAMALAAEEEQLHEKAEQSLLEARELARAMAAKWIEGARLVLEEGKIATERATTQWKTALIVKEQEATKRADLAKAALLLKLHEAEALLASRPEQLTARLQQQLDDALRIAQRAQDEVEAILTEAQCSGGDWAAQVKAVLIAKMEEAERIAADKLDAVLPAAETHLQKFP